MKKIIAGNWKMNLTEQEAEELLSALIPSVAKSEHTVVLCVPFTDLKTAARLTRGTNVHIGAQNVHWEVRGAFTGEISAPMLKEAGAEYVIVGHSERRTYFGDTDETVCRRACAALRHGLHPIVCVGETLRERESGSARTVLETQVKGSLRSVGAFDTEKLILAYEPVWAIGTGKTASVEQAEEAAGWIRGVLKELYPMAAENIPIQYGGSMNETNAARLLSMPNIDGGLIGGASLDAEKFSRIALIK